MQVKKFCVVLLAVGLAFVRGNILAQSVLGEVPVVQKTWFEIGYTFDSASESEDVTALQVKIPGPLPSNLISQLQLWAAGEAGKEAVRPLLVAHARKTAGYEALFAFRLGEWCSQVEDVVVTFTLGAVLEREEMVMNALLQMPTLTTQALWFIDGLAERTSSSVLTELEVIYNLTESLNPLQVVSGQLELDDLLGAITSLTEHIAAIKKAYGTQ